MSSQLRTPFAPRTPGGRYRGRRWLVLAAVPVLLTACGGNSSNTSSAAASSNPSSTAAGGSGDASSSGRQGTGNRPGVSGLIADVTDSTAQVQSGSAQTAVTWTAKTTFHKLATATASAVTVGSCVSVRSAQTGAAATQSPSSGSSGSADEVTAGSVEVSPAGSDGTCSSGFGGGAGGRGGNRPSGDASGAPSGMPSGAPSGMPSGAAGGGAGFGAIGKVTAVSSGGFTVSALSRTGGSTSQTSATARSVAVHTTASTAYTAQQSGKATDVVTGACLTATGTTDDTGALSATTITVSKAVDGACTSAMRGGGRRGGGQGMNGQSSSGTMSGSANA